MPIGEAQDQDTPQFWNLYRWLQNNWEWFGKYESPNPPTEEVFATWQDSNGNLRFPEGGQFSAVPAYDYGPGSEPERMKYRVAAPTTAAPASIAASVAPVAASAPADTAPLMAVLTQLAQAVDRVASTTAAQGQQLAEYQRRTDEKLETIGQSRFGGLLSQPPQYPPPDPQAGINAGVSAAAEMVKAFAPVMAARGRDRDGGGELAVIAQIMQQGQQAQMQMMQQNQQAQNTLLSTVLPLLARGGAPAQAPDDEFTRVIKKKAIEKLTSDDEPVAAKDEPSTLDVVDKVAERVQGLLLAKVDPKAFADAQIARMRQDAATQAAEQEQPAAPAPAPARLTAETVGEYLSTPGGLVSTIQGPKGEQVLQSLKAVLGELEPEQRKAFLGELGIPLD